MNILDFISTPPKSDYKNFYHLGKYTLTWNIIAYVSIGLFFVTLGYLIFDFEGFYPSVYGCVSVNLIWYLLYRKRDYYVVGLIFTFHSVIYLGVLMMILKTELHVIEYVWFVMFILFSFFVLGKKIGYLTILGSVIFISIYLFFFLENNLKFINLANSNFQAIATIANIGVAFFIISKIIIKFKDIQGHARNQFTEANKTLEQKNRLIEAQNEEKTIMLKEIHHRVKNNLQVVSSLIRLQSIETEDIEAKKMFDATVSRVIAMAMIHEKMYQKDNLSKINLEEYFNSLAQDLLTSYGTGKDITFIMESELEIIGNRTIVPLALIFNELISNSLKHAFQGVEKGEVNVSIKVFDQDNFIIKYQDNGRWVKNSEESSFGLELINTFTEQLDGEINRKSNEEGTKYVFKLKNIE